MQVKIADLILKKRLMCWVAIRTTHIPTPTIQGGAIIQTFHGGSKVKETIFSVLIRIKDSKAKVQNSNQISRSRMELEHLGRRVWRRYVRTRFGSACISLCFDDNKLLFCMNNFGTLMFAA